MGSGMLEWKDAYATGDPMIDAQHKELLKLADLMVEAARRGESETVQQAAFNALFRYTEKHFAAEEAFFKARGTPCLEEHCRKHAILKKELEGLWREHTLAYVETSQDALSTWVLDRLVYHMTHDDRAIIQDFRDRESASDSDSVKPSALDSS